MERPLGAKQVTLPGDQMPEEAVLDPYTRLEGELQRLATDAVTVLGRRLGTGDDTGAVVIDVIHDVFGGPAAALADPATMDRIVATVRAIISEEHA